MTGIDTAMHAPAILATAGGMPPPSASNQTGDATGSLRREVVSAAPNSAVSQEQIEGRAQLLQQRLRVDPALSTRVLSAIRAYRSLEDASEREQVSRLLGVDEYV